MRRAGLAVLVAVLLAGCSSALRWSADTHVVREGDTLFSIAARYDLDPRDLAAWNRLGDGRLIYPGQRLSLTGPQGAGRTSVRAGTPGAPPPRAVAPATPVKPVGDWRWPTQGSVGAAFGGAPGTQSGIQIAGQRGQAVRAAAQGQVVYAGSGLKAYGQLVIIKHNDSFLSAYGHNEILLVKEGDRVSAGQPIARMGEGPGQKPLLHFEIRRNGAPVDPQAYLPRR